MISDGDVWQQTPTKWDSTNLYLVASDVGVQGNAAVFTSTIGGSGPQGPQGNQEDQLLDLVPPRPAHIKFRARG